MKPLRNGNGTASRFGFLGFGTAGSNGNPARRRRWAKPLVQQIEQQQQLDEGDDEDGSSSSSESRISSDDNRKGKGMIASAQGRHGPTMTVDGGRLQLLTADQQQADEATKCSAADNELGSANEFEQREETMAQSLRRHARNLLHFFVEDWFISALLGCITAALSISVDVSYEYLNHYRAVLFDLAREYDKMAGFVSWVGFLVLFVTAAALVCRYVSRQAIGSGIPEVKVIMNGFSLPNYLSFRTLIAKIFSLILTLGSGLPVGKEGPFVHMVLLYTVFFILICVKLLGAIVGHLLSKLTWKSTAFFSNEGREVEILSSGCSVGIACTFSSPAGAVLYGIECTHKYFAVKNYWRAFFATTCSALIFRFANAAIIPPHIAGTITAYYQTSFPNEVFLIEEIPVFVLVGLISGLFGALFVLVHRKITYFKKRNRTFRAIFGRNSLSFTVFMALIVGIVTYPDGIGKFIAGKFTFRETLGDFIANCTMSLHNVSHSMGCSAKIIQRWTIADLELEGPRDRPTALDGSMDATVFMPNVFPSLFGYLIVNFFLVAICITLALPAGIFVPSFVIGACGGRIIGELMVVMFPEGIRGLDGPQIYPGLYAVVGAAAYTGAVTHSLSIAVIVCETTGQLSPLLPVLIALMVANAVSSFLQPSIYESIINIRKYPHLAELPPSRISVHTLKVEQIMVRDVVFITKQTSYKELRELLIATPHLRSYPLVTDDEEKILLGSVARKYLHFLLTSHLGPDPALLLYGCRRRKSRTVADGGSGSVEVNNYRRRHSSGLALLGQTAAAAPAAPKMSVMNERNLFGNTLLSISPLHEDRYPKNSHLAPLLMRQQQNSHQHQHNLLAAADLDKGTSNGNGSVGRPPFRRANRSALLRQPIDLDEVAIDAAPFQLVIGTSLYKVHTLFSLLGLNHAYVTHRGRLVGVVALRELRAALANIYTRGAVPPNQSMSRLRLNSQNFGNFGGSSTRNHSEDNGTLGGGSSSAGPLTQTTTTTTGTTEESPTSTGSGPCFQVERIEEPTISGQPFSQEKGKAQQQDGQRRVEVPVTMLISPPHSSASSSDSTTNMEATTAEEDDPFEPADGQQRPSRKQPEPEELAFPVNPVEQPPAANGVGRLDEGQQHPMRTRAHSDSAELRKRMGR